MYEKLSKIESKIQLANFFDKSALGDLSPE